MLKEKRLSDLQRVSLREDLVRIEGVLGKISS